MLESLLMTVNTLAERYGVNPVIFGVLYFGSMPFFAVSSAWWLRRWRQKRSTLLPMLITGLLFIGAYLYVLVAGHDLPVWVYFFIAVMLTVGGFSTWRTFQGSQKPPAA
ncbi:hypothetical protein EHF33_08450 [Deinococcus psychrotolerans]|uniref:Uncharacterized protein n=1 Tax=Deinococcus psychrotolerans TaxID=2489213 RepID=A0A3G8YMG2_9DEIO|nr:hypothetical protein [Deinococcus psychrotolerans]AZI42771.1 hypothetical protein EHF33_08450 [Deinococcus psychrotolerans]